MGNAGEKQMTDEEFFAWGERQEDRYELVEGFPVKMMTGSRNFHDLIVVNIIRERSNQLRGKQCRVMTARSRPVDFRAAGATRASGAAIRPETLNLHARRSP